MSLNKIALLTYSTKPRGGVVHTLSLAESLSELGQVVHVYALGTSKEFFRHVDVPYTLIPCPDIDYSSMDEKIKSYIEIYTDYLKSVVDDYDIFHAEDCISANALLNLRNMGLIDHYVRTIHHIDEFTSPSLIECQLKSVVEPDYVIAVSKYWEKELKQQYSLNAAVINNGVSASNYTKITESKEESKAKFNVSGAKVLLSIGGIEPRKNTITTLKAYQIAKSELEENAQRLVWLIGGGETLFDYKDYRDQFFLDAQELGLKLDEDIFVLGSVPEDKMPSLYNSADVFAFPSIKEGWGLVVLEAMASSVPVIASGIEPMTEYLIDEENALLISPLDYADLAQKISLLLGNPDLQAHFIKKGLSTAKMYSWENAAQKHIDFYNGILNQDSNLKAVGND
jgi:glycosyltransferase-like protein